MSTLAPSSLASMAAQRSEEHTSELQSPCNLVCRLLLEKKKKTFVRRFAPPKFESTYLQQLTHMKDITVSHFIVSSEYSGALEPKIPLRVSSLFTRTAFC